MSLQLAAFVSQDQQTEANLDQYLGIITSLTDPFNLFIRLSDFQNPEIDLVYLFIYSLGKKKIATWGTYSKKNQEISLDGACRYKVSQLMTLQRSWQEVGYDYVANAVIDRITAYFKEMMSPEEYLRKKFILARHRGQITQREFEKMTGKDYLDQFYDKLLIEMLEDDILSVDDLDSSEITESEEFQSYLADYLDDIEREIEEYILMINRADIDESIARRLTREELIILQELTQKFREKMERSSLTSDSVYSWLITCPDKEACDKPSQSCAVYFYGTQMLSELDIR